MLAEAARPAIGQGFFRALSGVEILPLSKPGSAFQTTRSLVVIGVTGSAYSSLLLRRVSANRVLILGIAKEGSLGMEAIFSKE